MKFKEAFEEMKSGIPVKLPSWAGYWWWDECTRKWSSCSI